MTFYAKFGVLLAALALTSGVELRAQSAPAAIPSPWTGSIVTGSGAEIPVNGITDAVWEQDTCVYAYGFEGVEAQIAAARDELANEITAFTALARQQGREEAEIETLVGQRFGGYRAELERRIAATEQRAEAARQIIPQCKGTFFRPAVEAACDGVEAKNRFCDQLEGALLPGVRLSDDRFVFAHALAAELEFLVDPGIAIVPAPWNAANNQPYEEPRYGLRFQADGSIYFETENGPRMPLFTDSMLYSLRKSRADVMEAASEAGIGFIYAINETVDRATGQAVPGGIGQWAFSIEMERALKTETADGALDLVRRMEQRAGLVGDLGEYAQLPRIHFQAHVPDILVQSDYARFVVEKADGTEIPLRDNAWFETPDERRAFFFTSSPSYRIHASLMPQPEEMAAILAADAAYLVARFEVLLHDGSIDLVTLRTPLAGIEAQWAEMNAVHSETRALLAAKAREWDSQFSDMEAELAADQARFEREKQLALSNAEKDARDYLAANPFLDNCPSLPVIGAMTTDASANNRRIGEVNACRAQWAPQAREAIAELGRLQRRYTAFGGTQTFIADERTRWLNAVERSNSEVADFNVALAAHNRQVEAHNARVASERRVAAANPSPAVRRYRSYERRQAGGNGGGRNYADEFYEAQGRPYVSIFRDVTIPPTPTRYMGTGYW